MAIPIRIIIPLLLFALLSFQAVYMYLEIKNNIADEILSDHMEKTAVSLRLMQDYIEKLYREKSPHLIQNELSKIAADPYISFAVVTDDKERIIATANNALLGEVLFDVADVALLISNQSQIRSLIEKVVTTRRGYVSRSETDNSLIGVYPVELGATIGRLRPDRVGLIVVLKDLRGLYSEAETKLLSKFRPIALLVLSILVAFSAIFYYLVGRRLAQLEQATIDISEGRRAAQIEQLGNDELGKLGRALNTMAERIQISQQKLSASERQFQNLTECSPVGIFRTDAKGNCIYVNKYWQDIAGVSAEKAMGQGWLDSIHPEDFERLSTEWQTALTENRPFKLEYRYQTAQYGTVWVLGQAVAEFNRKGDKIGYIGTITDITDRVRYQHQLEQQSLIINQTHDSVVLTDLDGFITSWNGGAERLFGHSMKNAIGRHISFIYPEDDKDLLHEQVLNPVMEKGEHELEVRMVRFSGEVFYANASMSLLKDPSGKVSGIINYLIDISHRKQAEEKLSKSEASLSEAQRIARLGNWSWDIVSDNLEWSDEVYRIFGLNPQQFQVNRDAFFTLVHPEDKSMMANALDDALYNMALYSLDHRIVLPDKSVRYVHQQAEVRFDDDGNPLRMIGTMQDITDRVFAERALKRSETRFRSTFEQAAVGVAHVTPDGDCLLVNERLCDIVGYTRDELMRLTIKEITHPDDVTRDNELRKELLAGQRPRYSIEKRFIKSNGDTVWINLTVSLVVDAKKQPEYFICVIEDISVRKKVEDKMEQTLKEKESLLQELHHRVKNNMQVISSILSLQSRNINADNIQRVFDESRQRIKAMSLVHERLYSSGDLSHIDIKEYLDYLATKLRGLHGSSTRKVAISVKGKTIQLPVDAALPVALIVNELLTNAIYHAYDEAEEVKIEVVLESIDSSQYRIRVRDFGQGFDYKKATESGTSSGLMIIHALSMQLHTNVGYINDNGTVATLVIPVDEAEKQALAS